MDILESTCRMLCQTAQPSLDLFENRNKFLSVNYSHIITIEPGKRGGKSCIRGMRITVGDVLGWLAAGMSHREIVEDYPELTEEDIVASLAFAADRERRIHTVVNAA